jgi:hypothetical protein
MRDMARLDMLPYIRFRIYDAHVRLICSAVDEGPVIHLEEGISRVIRCQLASRCALRKWYNEQLAVKL